MVLLELITRKKIGENGFARRTAAKLFALEAEEVRQESPPDAPDSLLNLAAMWVPFTPHLPIVLVILLHFSRLVFFQKLKHRAPFWSGRCMEYEAEERPSADETRAWLEVRTVACHRFLEPRKPSSAHCADLEV